LSNRYTVIEVSGRDRVGLLYAITDILSRLNLNIGSAHIVTFGEKAADVFYVTDLTGAKITTSGRKASIRQKLLDAFPRAAGAAKPAPIAPPPADGDGATA
jgi:[protein-PII] uridylyltransferase